MNYRSLARNVLMSGASLAAMVVGSSLRAHAASLTISGQTSAPAVNVTTAQTFDLVLINNSTVTGNVTNSGSIGISQIGLEIEESEIQGGVINNAGATISATGIGIHVSDAMIDDGVLNAGTISVSAQSILTTDDVVLGIGVLGVDAAVSTSITNSGNITVYSGGAGIQGNANGSFLAVAGIAVAGSSGVAAVISNSGEINVTASRSGGTTVLAQATGIAVVDPEQGGNGGDVSITNSGALNVTAYAAGEEAVALASGVGVWVASTQVELGLDLTNSSDGVISVLGEAIGDDTARAHVYGIEQNAFGARGVSIDLVNNGSIGISASAFAGSSEIKAASAEAAISDGVYQSAISLDSEGDGATVSLTNTSNLSLDIIASATASATSQVTAMASLSTAVGQYASGDVASITLDNSGAINIVADANALISESTGEADAVAEARALIDDGVEQIISDDTDSPDDNATAGLVLTNDGTLTIKALAGAISVGSADAFATIISGVSQNAEDAVDASVDLFNNGTMTLLAEAQASGQQDADAFASIADGVYQSASAVGASGGSASVSLTNTSDISLKSLANATAAEAVASATASIGSQEDSEDFYAGIGQFSYHADEATITLNNSGTISILAEANAGGTAEEAASSADADAYIYAGLFQGASQDSSEHEDDPDVANASAGLVLTNSGTITIKALADATGIRADAYASVHEGVTQYAFEAADGSAVINNSGSLNVLVQAVARGTDRAYPLNAHTHNM